MLTLPVLTTVRLRIRPFTPADLDNTFKLHTAIGWADPEQTSDEQLAYSRRYVEWNSLNHQALAELYQPPTGDRVVELQETGEFVGLCGAASVWGPYGRLPSFGRDPNSLSWPEVGLFWAILPKHQGRGYAPEMARALIDALFDRFHLRRIMAFTARDNLASRRVMEKVGMAVEENPFPDPDWLQVAGIIKHPKEVASRG
jgi:[ribosomal protein S5]-alanine N-acetyltransferase